MDSKSPNTPRALDIHFTFSSDHYCLCFHHWKYTGLTTDDSNYEERIILGVDVNNQRVMDALARNVGLSHLLRTKSEIRNQNQFQGELANRIAQLYSKYGPTEPKPRSAQTYIEGLAYFQDESGAFDSERYNDFINLVNVNPDISENQFIQTLVEDYKIESLNSVVEGPGFYIEPAESIHLGSNEIRLTIYTI